LVQIVYGDQIELFQLTEVLPVEVAHFPHAFDGDFLRIGAVDVPHEDCDVRQELQAPLHELVVVTVDLVRIAVVVLPHQSGQLVPNDLQYVGRQFHDQLLVGFARAVSDDHPVVNLQLSQQVIVDLVDVDQVDLALDDLVVLILRKDLSSVELKNTFVEGL
jgi:hypothetical protein